MLRIRKLAVGIHHCVAVGQSGEVLGWGSNKSNQLSHAPVQRLREITRLQYTRVKRPRATHVWATERFSAIYHVEGTSNDAYLSVLGESAWQLPDAMASGGQMQYYATEVSRPRTREHSLRISDHCRTLVTNGYVRGNRAMSCFVMPSEQHHQVATREHTNGTGSISRQRCRSQSSLHKTQLQATTRSRSRSAAVSTKDVASVRSHSPYRLARSGRQSRERTRSRRFSESGLPAMRGQSEDRADVLSSNMLEHLQLLIDR